MELSIYFCIVIALFTSVIAATIEKRVGFIESNMSDSYLIAFLPILIPINFLSNLGLLAVIGWAIFKTHWYVVIPAVLITGLFAGFFAIKVFFPPGNARERIEKFAIWIPSIIVFSRIISSVMIVIAAVLLWNIDSMF